MMDFPLVNVIIPVYKIKAEHLTESVNSILNQTYTHIIIIIIIDEGPENISKDILKNIHDMRLQIIENGKNMGLPYSLKRGIEASTGKYIMRMDGDDIAMPNRIEEQVKYMEKHPDVDVCATYAETFGDKKRIYSSSTGDEGLKGELLWKNPIIHPTVAFRAETIRKKNIRYMPGVSEDYRLWLEMAYTYGCKFAVLPQILLKYRIHSTQLTQMDKSKMIEQDKDVVRRILDILDVNATGSEIQAFSKCRMEVRMGCQEIADCSKLMKKIVKNCPAGISASQVKKAFTKGLVKSAIRRN